MRLFTAIDLPVEVRGKLGLLLDGLRPKARIKWSPVENLHLTTKFIGEWPENRLADLTAALREVPGVPAIPIALRGLGWYPNARVPRVFWAGIAACPALSELAHNTDQALGPLGIARETRDFSPHLTLARIKEQAPLENLRRAIDSLPSEELGEFTADRFYLYLSEPGQSGSLYSKLEEFVFAGS
jgi:2'-5' RNA ligase